MSKPTETEKYKLWVKELMSLNDRINNLTVWNDYAEFLQSKYDQLLSEEPEKYEKD